MKHAAENRATQAPARCLILAPGGCEAPAELIDALRRRAAVLREVADAPAAMAALAVEKINVLVIVEPLLVRQVTELVRAVGHYHPAVRIWRFTRSRAPALGPWSDADLAGVRVRPSDPPESATNTRRESGGAPPDASPPASGAAPGLSAVERELLRLDGQPADRTESPEPMAGDAAYDQTNESDLALRQQVADHFGVLDLSADAEVDSADEPAAAEAAEDDTPDEDDSTLLTDEELAMLLADDDDSVAGPGDRA